VAIAPPDSPYGSPDSVLEPARANFTQILALDPDVATRARLDALWVWTEREHTRLAPLMVARKVSGQVRECHGDLHLGNVALIDERPVLFDCIEFNPSLRWIDVMSEVAFTVMDLMDHGRPALAHRFLNTYLEVTGDYTGAPLLGYYAVYRALVRAKVAFIRAHQPGTSSTERTQALTAFERHVDLAEGLGRATAPRLIITHGLSGSGKTTVAQFLLEQLGAVRIRSDVERKRLFGLAANAKTVRGVSRGIYAANANRRTYDRLAELASAMLAAGVSVIVDATFLRRAERDRFRALARTHGAPFALVVCDAPAKVLRGRVAQRAQAGRDASEADASVLEAQLQSAELLGNDERIEAHMIATDRPLEEIRRACDALAITLLSESVTGT
jgi:predicted kinase